MPSSKKRTYLTLQKKVKFIKAAEKDFLPANTTSYLQPLDLGIIQNFIVHYRTLPLKYLIDKYSSASEGADFINILVAIRWVAQAWEKVNSSTIKKYFGRAGILNYDMSRVVSCEIKNNPFDDLDEYTNLQEVINQVNLPKTCSVQEYTNGDKDVPVCSFRSPQKNHQKK